MMHQMKLQNSPFMKIKNGIKTIELRLNDKKRQQVQVGDFIEFTLIDNSDEKIQTRVTALHHFDSFQELYASLPKEKLGYSPSETPVPDHMDAFYPREKQEKYGALGIELRMTEWCEMVNGSDYTMDSAFNMADVIMQDIKELDVTAWQYWVGVANGGYRDGLIYVSTSARACRPAKRLWAMGNFSKFIRPGYVRVDTSHKYKDILNLDTVAFTGINKDGQEELVIVVINKEKEAKTIQMGLADFGKYNYYEVYTTNENRDLEMTQNGALEQYSPMTLEAESIITIRLINQ